eukprot:g33161.t1
MAGVFSPYLYSLYPHNCVATFSSNSIYRFADDTTIVGKTSNNDETEYRKEKEIESLVAWCKDSNLPLNVGKTKELVVGIRKWSGGHPTICINGARVEVIESFKFQEVNITNNQSCHVNTIAEKVHQHLYFLRRLRKVV